MKRLGLLLPACLIVGAVFAAQAGAARTGTSPVAPGRYIVIAKDTSSFNAARTAAGRIGSVSLASPAMNFFVVSNATKAKADALASKHVKVIPDRIESLVRPGMYSEFGMNDPSKMTLAKAKQMLSARAHATAANPFANAYRSGLPNDPALGLGAQWNVQRIGSPMAWDVTTGSDQVLVAVADTGLDYTHGELANQVIDGGVVDFSTTEVPQICSTFVAPFGDADLASAFGGPVNGDWNGHGSWIGGNIAAEANGNALNGIAPNVKLVALKISQWCGSAYDSEIISAFIWAAEHGIDVVSISFGGYLDRSDPFQDAIYQLYVDVVKFARSEGTTIVSSLGNEHAEIGKGGKVISHGILTAPPGGDDLFGLYENPAGIPGVVAVAATGNVVNAPSDTCSDDQLGLLDGYAHLTCKPAGDAHQPFGVGKQNQPAYYSNYGKRTDVSAPGGARMFNLPVWDGGGSEGWPYTGDDSAEPFPWSSHGTGHNAWETFSITSNWALEIPCFIFDGSSANPDDDGYFGAPDIAGFDNSQCYSTIQGTSMATPHASAVLALIASAFPSMAHDPSALIAHLKDTATPLSGNTVPPVSATDTSPADYTGAPCPGGYCHLGGAPIKDKIAYGAGLVNAAAAVAGG